MALGVAYSKGYVEWSHVGGNKIDMICCGMVGVVWYGMVWCGAVRCGTVG